MKILLVDDSKTMRNIQKSILAQLGYTEIQEAADGLDAFSKLGAFQPDLMLVDWNMPNMDGLTFVKQYRAKGNKTPIIMVTTEAEKVRVIEAIKAGVNNYVVKPFTPESLSERIKETVARASQAA
jgi:two-component system chemotaxis response regulator CheY